MSFNVFHILKKTSNFPKYIIKYKGDGKAWSCKHEDLSLIVIIHVKSLACVPASNPITAEAEIRGSLELVDLPVKPVAELYIQ